MENRSKLKLANKCHELVSFSRIKLRQYPNAERFSLTMEIKNSARLMHRLSIRLSQAEHKKKLLDTLDEEVQVFRTLIYDSKSYGYINFDTYEEWSYFIAEVGKMVGQWKENIKQDANKAKTSAINRYNKR